MVISGPVVHGCSVDSVVRAKTAEQLSNVFLFACYRPQQSCSKVMFLHLYVSHSVLRGACVSWGWVCARGHACLGGRHAQVAVHAKGGACVPGGCACPWGVHAQGGCACLRDGCVVGRMHAQGGVHAWGHACPGGAW